MANRTAWAAGTLAPTYTSAFIAADLNALPSLAAVMSTTSFDNTVATIGTPDQFMDVSFVGAFAAAQTVAAGAGIAIFIYALAHDGSSFGSQRLVAGVQRSPFSPLQNPIGGIPLDLDTGVTTFAGTCLGVAIPPRAFKLAVQNQTGFAWAASGCSCSIVTYRQATNA